MAIVKKIAMDSDFSSGQHCLTSVGPEAPVLLLNQANISFGASGTDSDVTENILRRKATNMGIHHQESSQVQHKTSYRFLYA